MSSSILRILQVAVVATAVGSSSLAFAAEGLTGRLAERARDEGRNSQRDQRGNAQSAPARESRPAPRSEPRAQEPRVAQPSRSERPQREAPTVLRPQPSREPAREPSRNAAAPGVPRSGDARAARDDSNRSGGITQRLAPRPQQRAEAPSAAAAPQPSAGNVRGPVRPSAGVDRDRNERGGDRDDRSANRGGNASSGDRGLTGNLIQRNYQTRDDGPSRGSDGRDRDRDRNDYRGPQRPEWYDRHRSWHREHRPGRVIHHLPVGYRSYYWDRHNYYYHGGAWYRPHGNTFISVGIPFGLFVTTLPGAYTSFYYGSTRYYYSDYNYYLYEPSRHGYVVTRSPYGDDEYDESQDYDRRLDQDLYIYPAQGQSEQQQADDRYECHRWAVSETDYDPIDDEYDADLREDYLRAMTACLTGRGYTVR